MKDRVILHCDLNNFYASVECILNPGLKDKCVAVCGSSDMRHGIVLAKNMAAKQYGVRTAEVIWQAKQKCPDLVCVPPHMDLYVEYAKQVRDIYKRFTDQIESFGLDECWLDVTGSVGLFGSGEQMADRIRALVKVETELTVSVGVSFNKVFAKLGSDMKKPDATTVLSRENYKAKIHNLPAGEMMYVGRKTQEKLQKLGVITLGDLAAADEGMLRQAFGICGTQMKRCAMGLDDSPVVTNLVSDKIKSVGHGVTTRYDICNYAEARQVISMLAEMVATRLRRYALAARTVHVDLRYNDLTHITRQTTLAEPTCVSDTVDAAAYELLQHNWAPETDLPLRTITLSTSTLTPFEGGTQVSLFDAGDGKRQNAEQALDKIRKKYGFSAVKKARTLNMPCADGGAVEEDEILPFKR